MSRSAHNRSRSRALFYRRLAAQAPLVHPGGRGMTYFPAGADFGGLPGQPPNIHRSSVSEQTSAGRSPHPPCNPSEPGSDVATQQLAAYPPAAPAAPPSLPGLSPCDEHLLAVLLDRREIPPLWLAWLLLVATLALFFAALQCGWIEVWPC